MTRQKLEKAIALGLRRAAGKDPAAIAGLIADAIETAIEMEEETTAPAPEKVMDWPVQVAPAPPAASIQPSAQRTPLVEIPAQVRHIQESPAENPTPITLERLLAVLHEQTPPQVYLEIDYGQGPVGILLDRNVIAEPLSKSARLIYRHPKAPEGVEASLVYLAENGVPDLATGLEKLQALARKIYGPRTQSPPVAVRDVPEGKLFAPQYCVQETAASAAPDMSEIANRSFPGGFKSNLQ